MISVIRMLTNCWCLIYHVFTLSLGLTDVHPLNETEVAPSKPRLNLEIVKGHVVNFFNPVTCHPKENQELEPCQAGGNINKTLCLKHECCASSKKHIRPDCYIPLKNNGLRILRMFGVGLIGVLLVGCLPFCCCIVEKSSCFNPLRRAPKKEVSDSDSDSSYESDYQ